MSSSFPLVLVVGVTSAMVGCQELSDLKTSTWGRPCQILLSVLNAPPRLQLFHPELAQRCATTAGARSPNIYELCVESWFKYIVKEVTYASIF